MGFRPVGSCCALATETTNETIHRNDEERSNKARGRIGGMTTSMVIFGGGKRRDPDDSNDNWGSSICEWQALRKEDGRIDHARGSLQKTEQHLVCRTKMFLYCGGHSLCSPLGNDKNQGPLILVSFSFLSLLSLLLLYFFGYHSKTQGCFAHN